VAKIIGSVVGITLRYKISEEIRERLQTDDMVEDKTTRGMNDSARVRGMHTFMIQYEDVTWTAHIQYGRNNMNNLGTGFQFNHCHMKKNKKNLFAPL
jgi:hypothetical protein